jgi:hypothetical protein
LEKAYNQTEGERVRHSATKKRGHTLIGSKKKNLMGSNELGYLYIEVGGPAGGAV